MLKSKLNEMLLTIACYSAGVSKEAIAGKSRKQEYTMPRHQIIALLRQEGLKLMEIGRLLNRDHTTILYSEGKHEDYMYIDEHYNRQFNNLQEKFKNKIENLKIAGLKCSELSKSNLSEAEISTVERLNKRFNKKGLNVAVF